MAWAFLDLCADKARRAVVLNSESEGILSFDVFVIFFRFDPSFLLLDFCTPKLTRPSGQSRMVLQ